MHFCDKNSKVWIVTEYAQNGKLQSYLDNKFGQSTSELEARHIIGQILRCISYWHQKAVVHGNITPNNVYITRNMDSEEKLINNTFDDSDSSDNSYCEPWTDYLGVPNGTQYQSIVPKVRFIVF